MLRFIVGFIVSVVITNWAYSELVMIDPGVKDAIDLASEQLTLPTHNQWGRYFEKVSFDWDFNEEIEKVYAQLEEYNPVTKFNNIKRIVREKRNGTKRIEKRKERMFEMVSDDQMFVQYS